MNNEKFKKSLDEIKPSQALINKTLMNIKEKKKINYFMPFYMASLAAVCSIILIATYIINDNSTTTNSINNNFLIEITGEYTFEHIFDFNVLPEEKFNNIYVLKYGDKIEDNDYTIPYKYYVAFIKNLEPLKENKINTLKDFKEENYDKVVINDEKYFYVSNQEENLDLIFYDKTTQVHYQIETTIEQDKAIHDIKSFIYWFTLMSGRENFIDQTHIKNIKQTNYQGMYLVEKTNMNGEWQSYVKSKEYNDYLELVAYLERLRYNNVNKTIDEFDASKYYGNMLIQLGGHYIYVPETINDKILISNPEWVHPVYYEIELKSKDYSTLESIKNLIKTRNNENNTAQSNNQYQTHVDPVTGVNIMTSKRLIYYAEVGTEGTNNLYITLDTNIIKNNPTAPRDISRIENNPTIMIDEHVRDYEISGAKGTYYCTIVYVTKDKKLK